jgi:hypothetical protein
MTVNDDYAFAVDPPGSEHIPRSRHPTGAYPRSGVTATPPSGHGLRPESRARIVRTLLRPDFGLAHSS